MASMRWTILAESQPIVHGCIFGEGQRYNILPAHSAVRCSLRLRRIGIYFDSIAL